MDLQLSGKTALVTGSTAGIGLAIAQELAAEGAMTYVVGRSQDKVDAALAQIEGEATGLAADLGQASGAARTLELLPEVDILVNNLGVYESRAFGDIADEEWLRIFEINVMSGVRLSRAFLPGMLERDFGRILFISSESGVQTPPEMIHYGMTKSAQLAISRGLAEITKATGVTVNSLLPGPTRSEGIVDFLHNMASNPDATDAEAEAEFFAKHRSSSLLQRLIEGREVATMAAYLASPLSAATNGAAVKVEGGLLRSIV